MYTFSNVISRDLLNDVFDKLELTSHHIGGVFHAATNLKDMPFSKITEKTFMRVRCKAIGGLNLHKIVKERAIDLDYFSLTGVEYRELLVKVRTLRQTFFLIVLLRTGEERGSMRIQFVLALFRALAWSPKTQICRTN